MSKIKAFGCIVLVIASVMVFSFSIIQSEAWSKTSCPTFEEVFRNKEDYPDLEIVELECLNCYMGAVTPPGEFTSSRVSVYGTIKNPNNGKVIRKRVITTVLTQTGVGRHSSERPFELNPGETASFTFRKGNAIGGASAQSLIIDLKSVEVFGLMVKPSPTPETTPTPVATPAPTPVVTPSPEVTIPTPEETPTVVTPTPTPQLEDSDGDGVPDKYDYAPNDPKVQTKEDVKTPGFGAILAIGSLLAVAYLVLRRRR